MQGMAGRWRRAIVEAGGLAVAIILPLCFNPWATPPFEPAKVAIFRGVVAMMGAATAIIWLAEAIRSRGSVSRPQARCWWTDNPVAMPALGYATAYVLATATSIAPPLSLWGPHDNPQGTITVLCAVIFFLLIASGLQTKAQFDRLVSALILGSVAVAVYGLSQFFGIDSLPWITDSVSPVLSTLGRSNFLGAYLAMVVPFTLLRIADGDRGGSRARYAFVLALQVACLWLTLARAAWIGLLGGVLLFLGLLAQRRRSRALWWIALVMLILGVWLYAAMNVTALPRWGQAAAGAQSGQSIPFADLRDASVNARLTIWRTTLGLIRDRWLLGYGPEQFTAVFAAHYPPELARFEGPQVVVDDPHNLFLDQTMAVGVIGLAALLGVLIVFYRLMLVALHRCTNRSSESALAAILGSVTAFVIQAQFNPDVIVLSAFFWLFLALGVVIARGNRTNSQVIGQAG